MPLRKPRITVRRLLGLVAVVAVGLGIAREFGEGLPPRFLIRDIPRRVERLRPGMTREQVSETLGMDRSWYLGGLGWFGDVHCYGGDFLQTKLYHVGGRRPPESSAVIRLTFRNPRDEPYWMGGDFPFFVMASFEFANKVVAKSPEPSRYFP